jgi:hypothetical protein
MLVVMRAMAACRSRAESNKKWPNCAGGTKLPLFYPH